MSRRNQKGASLIIVLVVLMILLLGALSMARVNETTSLIAGNIAFKDSSMQASEVGVSEAFAQLATIADDEQNQGGWYFATIQGDDAAGLPAGMDWTGATSTSVGPFKVRYVVERQCAGATPIADMNAQCLIKKLPSTGSAKVGMESLEQAASKQYRITAFVTGPKNTQTYVQTMVVR
jgi:type IV pilus assembly protein PilX